MKCPKCGGISEFQPPAKYVFTTTVQVKCLNNQCSHIWSISYDEYDIERKEVNQLPKMKVKVLESDNHKDLEKQVNDYLETVDSKFHEFHYNHSMDIEGEKYSVMIVMH